jgi:hypothetical protein
VQQNALKVVKVKNTIVSLKMSLVRIERKLEELFGGDYSQFTKYASMLEHLYILKRDGSL